MTDHDGELKRRLLDAKARNFVRYALERGLTPDEFNDLFDEGIVRIAETYKEDHPLRMKVLIGSRSDAVFPLLQQLRGEVRQLLSLQQACLK